MNLSIIIPHYNNPKTLARTLESIKAENNVEVIVIDDNSDKDLDELEKCREKYAQKGITFLSNDSGIKGAGAARNIGLRQAKGDWILFADADDYFLDGMYNAVSRYFSQQEYDIIFFLPVSEYGSQDNPGGRDRTELYELMCEAFVANASKTKLYLRYFWFTPWSRLIRKKILDEYNILFNEVMYSNDVVFSAKTGYYAKDVYVDVTPIYCVTSNNSLLTKNNDSEAFLIRTKEACERFKFLREHLEAGEFRQINHPDTLNRLYIIIRRKYGFACLVKCYKLFKNYRLRTISCKTPLRKVIKSIIIQHGELKRAK